MENGNNSGCGSSSSSGEKHTHSLRLSDVVSDCSRRWFQDTLKEAKAGDLSMQVLVAQMYFNGYGIPKDHQKAKIWMTRAARVRSSVWKVSTKRPGYNASDSDSEELLDDS
ncbi:putative tetratricopeptide-like helical domain superfamily [Helianthus debilis subsp. tardiflorus]